MIKLYQTMTTNVQHITCNRQKITKNMTCTWRFGKMVTLR